MLKRINLEQAVLTANPPKYPTEFGGSEDMIDCANAFLLLYLESNDSPYSNESIAIFHVEIDAFSAAKCDAQARRSLYFLLAYPRFLPIIASSDWPKISSSPKCVTKLNSKQFETTCSQKLATTRARNQQRQRLKARALAEEAPRRSDRTDQHKTH